MLDVRNAKVAVWQKEVIEFLRLNGHASMHVTMDAIVMYLSARRVPSIGHPVRTMTRSTS